MKVDIYVDVVCPWSYLGKRRFEAALADFDGRADVQIEWKPFLLDQANVDGPASTDASGSAGVGEDDVDVTVAAAAAGLTYDLPNARTQNSFDALRLLWWARAEGGADRQTALAERLFAAHLTEAADLGDHAALGALAAEAGLDGAAAFLASDAGVAEVREEIGEARAMGIESSPTFVFEERWAVSGAQPVDVMGTLLAQVADATITATGGGCCGGGCCG